MTFFIETIVHRKTHMRSLLDPGSTSDFPYSSVIQNMRKVYS